MDIDSKATQLITKLTRETFANNLHWAISNPPRNLISGTEDIIPLYFEANYKDARVGLFLKRYKSYYDVDEYSWNQEYGLCMQDNVGHVIWEYKERSSALVNLFEAAREQASGINKLLDKLLDDSI